VSSFDNRLTDCGHGEGNVTLWYLVTIILTTSHGFTILVLLYGS